jgi:5-methylcytosine-specific restriction endonuclease McrBC regulatory subunit McrC
MIDRSQLLTWFTYHESLDFEIEQYQRIRTAALALAQVICDNTPEGADQSAAIRKVREAVMTANAAIACFRR